MITVGAVFLIVSGLLVLAAWILACLEIWWKVYKYCKGIPGLVRKVNEAIEHSKCKWNKKAGFDADEYFETDCGQAQYFSEGDVDANCYKFCPYCGNKIEVSK